MFGVLHAHCLHKSTGRTPDSLCSGLSANPCKRVFALELQRQQQLRPWSERRTGTEVAEESVLDHTVCDAFSQHTTGQWEETLCVPYKRLQAAEAEDRKALGKLSAGLGSKCCHVVIEVRRCRRRRLLDAYSGVEVCGTLQVTTNCGQTTTALGAWNNVLGSARSMTRTWASGKAIAVVLYMEKDRYSLGAGVWYWRSGHRAQLLVTLANMTELCLVL